MERNTMKYLVLLNRAALARQAAEKVQRQGKGKLPRIFYEHAQMWSNMAQKLETDREGRREPPALPRRSFETRQGR